MKNGFFTKWDRRWAKDQAHKQHPEDPEINKTKLFGNYFVPKPSKENSRVCVDLGAAQGHFAMNYCKSFDRIYCFEPCWPNFKKLSRNITRSEEFDHIVYFNYCAGQPEELNSKKILIPYSNFSTGLVELTFYPNFSPYGATLFTDSYTSGTKRVIASHMVPIISLEDILSLIREEHIDYLKCDIEGSEYEFLIDQDMSKIDILSIEMHPKIIGGKKSAKLLKHMNNQGFRLCLDGKLTKRSPSKGLSSSSIYELTLYNLNNENRIKTRWKL